MAHTDLRSFLCCVEEESQLLRIAEEAMLKPDISGDPGDLPAGHLARRNRSPNT